MNKTRAMLDALMGPGRDVLDKGNKKDKFKEDSVCKNFLVGFCPFDKAVLGGKRKLDLCEKVHSDMMKEQFQNHGDKEEFQKEYERLLLRDLEYCIRECENHIASEKVRIRDDVRRKKPPLPAAINDQLSQMRKESAACITQAEQLDDDAFREKEALLKKSAELTKDREAMLEEETKKARDAMVPEEVCEICGQAYEGDEARELHLKFKVHEGYTRVRDKVAELKPRVENFEKARKETREQEARKRRKDAWDNALEKDVERNKDRDRDRGEERPRGRSRSRSRRRGRDGDRDGYRDSGRNGYRDGGRDVREVRDRRYDGSRSRGRNRGRR